MSFSGGNRFYVKNDVLNSTKYKKSMQKAYTLLHTPSFNSQQIDFEYFFNVYQHCKQSTLYPRRFTSEELGRIKVPVLIVIGIDEHFFDVKKAEYWGNKHIPLSQMHILENAGHLAHIDRPEAVLSLVIGFH